MCVTSTKILSICSCLALLLFMARKKRRTGVGGPRAVPEDPDFDIVDRDEAGQPDLTEAQRKRKASGEARAARSRNNTFHARKAKLAHLIDHLPQALWDAFLDKAVRPRVKAISERGVIGSLLLGFLVRLTSILQMWLRPVKSMAKRSQVRGLMCLTSINNITRFYDRDVSAALNIRRCAVGPGPRPTELCYWNNRPAMPKPGQPGQEWVEIADKPLLLKWQRQLQQ
ncbi:hypothetical protein QJQ45_023835 [Haematococcus lacustris]|nr:hypothetical protein QJQ45_023835 [Haematococcus lacustris]